MAMTYAMHEGIYLRKFLQYLLQKYMIIYLYVDNKGVIDSEKKVHIKDHKHMDIRYDFMGHKVMDDIASLNYV